MEDNPETYADQDHKLEWQS
jgi:hypothetical protein